MALAGKFGGWLGKNIFLIEWSCTRLLINSEKASTLLYWRKM